MSIEDLDVLLARMPSIAEAVNVFASEVVQQQAFNVLVDALRDSASSRSDTSAGQDAGGEADEQEVASKNARTSGARKARKTRSTAGGRDNSAPVRNLELRPDGKQSFSDFVAEKQPSSNQDKFAVAIYWLEQVASINPITVGHIAAMFKQTEGWRESGNIRAGLTMTANRKNTIDTEDLDDLKTTPHGRNFVKHDLPSKKGGK